MAYALLEELNLAGVKLFVRGLPQNTVLKEIVQNNSNRQTFSSVTRNRHGPSDC